MTRVTSHLGRRMPRLWQFYDEGRLLVHALRNGLWRSLSPGGRGNAEVQQVLTWQVAMPDRDDAGAVVTRLRDVGLRVAEGGNAFYLPPQPGLAKVLGPVVHRYPPDSGFKVLRDFRDFSVAHYLRPDRQTLLRRRLIGTPHDQLVAANYLHDLDLGPRVWDVCVLRSPHVSMPAFVMQHIQGTVPTHTEWSAFIHRLRHALATTELRITVPHWERNKDFRAPGCNGNLLRDPHGVLSYIDFQNFSVRDPRRLLTSRDHLLPPASLPAGADIPGRFRAFCHLLRQLGVDLAERLVLAAGRDAADLLRRALSAGAWWALGWAELETVPHAHAMATAQGFTRLEIVGADLRRAHNLTASIPQWLRAHLDGSIVFCGTPRPHLNTLRSFVQLPWQVLVYEGAPDEPRTQAEHDFRSFADAGIRVVHSLDYPAPASPNGPLLAMVREKHAMPSRAR